jgi:ribosomal protein L32E
MVYQVRARTHRKKRIDKKWMKRYGYRSMPRKDVIVAGNVIYAHPSTVMHLQAMLKEE